jgi:hypothetical protein
MSLLSKLLEWFRKIGAALSSLFGSAVNAETGVIDAYFTIRDDIEAFVKNLTAFKKFEFDPQWKTRVISLPRAWDGIWELFDIIFHGLRDKFEELQIATETVLNVLKQAQRPPDDGPSGIANVQEKLTTFKLAVVDFQKAFHTALEIEQTLIDIKNRLETLDDLFLPQGSSKVAGDYHYRKRNA